jgi:ribonuclease HI
MDQTSTTDNQGQYISSAAMAEAMAPMKIGLQLASSLGCNNIICEGDSMETIEACTGETIWWNEAVAVFADCVDISTTIDHVKFQHCPREANEVAHVLARDCFMSKVGCNWVDEPPSIILAKLIDDVTVV